MQSNVQDLLDDRHIQAEEPSLDSGSVITKEGKQNAHDRIANRALPRIGTVPSPWDTFYQFGRMIWWGIVVTFGRTASATGKASGHRTEMSCSAAARVKSGPTLGPHELAPRIAEAIAGPAVVPSPEANSPQL